MRYAGTVTTEDPRKGGWLSLFMLFAALVPIGAFLVCEIYDLDIWWHLAIGRDILDHLAIPRLDSYAAAALGRPYHDSHWLFQVIMALCDRFAGIAGVELLTIALWGSTFFFCYRASHRWVDAPVAAILLFAAAMASIERFLPRPEIITYFMVAFFYWGLQERKYRRITGLAALGLLQVVWANCHGLFVIGPFLALCPWAVAAWRNIAGRPSADFRELSRLVVLLLGATLVTPYFFEGWRYAFLLFSEAGPSAPQTLKSLGELSPTFGAAARSAPAFWFFALLLATTLAVTLVAAFRKRLSPERLLMVVALLAAALSGRRNMVLFALVAAPFIAENVALLSFRPRRWADAASAVVGVAMMAWAWFPLSGSYYLMMEIPARFGVGATPSFFPRALPAFLEQIGFRGQVFNSNTLGGFYLYHSYPGRIPLTDGRWEIYDRERLAGINRAPRDQALWARLVSSYDIRGVLLQHASPEARGLLPSFVRDSRWRLVYYDYAASFWVRSEDARAIPAISLAAAGAALPPSARLDDYIMLDLFYRLTESGPLRLKNLERSLAFSWGIVPRLEQVGLAQLQAGMAAAAEKTFLTLLGKSPKNLAALNELSFLAYNRRDLNAASGYLGRALEVDPGNQQLRANYQLLRNSLERGGASR